MNRIQLYKENQTGLGLASNSYKQVLQAGEIRLTELMAWAAGRGFSWIEIRDPKAEMRMEELKEIKEIAQRLKIEIHYSWDNQDVLEESPDFYRGMENAAFFGKGTCCRVLLAADAVKGKKGCTREEMERLVPTVNTYVKKAEEMGITLCFENAAEPLKGDGQTYFGMEDILENCPNMNVTFDAANATNCTTLINPKEEELLAYYHKFSERIGYFHLKMTRNHQLLAAVEEEGDFSPKALFHAFSSHPEMKICLELPQQPTWETMTAAVEHSIEVLKKIQCSEN